MTWKQDHDWLRAEAKKNPQGIRGTIIFVLLSHMRGKIHMRWCNKWQGGWRKVQDRQLLGLIAVPTHFVKAYGEDHATRYFVGSKIDSLEDQAAWIRAYVVNASKRFWYLGGMRPAFPEAAEIAKRILDSYQEPDKKEEVPPLCNGSTRRSNDPRDARSIRAGGVLQFIRSVGVIFGRLVKNATRPCISAKTYRGLP